MASVVHADQPTRAVFSLKAIVASAVLALGGGCLGAPEDAQTTQDLTVCHTTVVEGVDVSEFQGGSINWGSVHASGRDFAVARIGDGTYVDPDFASNWAGIAAAGMVRGGYLFFRPTDSAASQAATISAAVGHLGNGDLPVTIDVECMCPASVAPSCSSETAGCVSSATAASVLRSLVSLVQADTGKVPMIYTGDWFWDGSTYLNGALTLPDNPLWVSGYTTGCVTVPSGWTDWRIWQYTDGTCAGCPTVGTVPGIGQSVDRDRFNGTLADLTTFAGSPDWGAQFVSQTFPYASVGAVDIPATTTHSISLVLRNIGTHAWDTHTCIGTTEPHDRTDAFADSSWPSANRPACVTGTVAPGATHTFTWLMHAPSATGSYDEHWGVVEDGVTWFSAAGEGGPPDSDLEGIFDVTAAPPHDAGFPDVGFPDVGFPDIGVVATDTGPTEIDAGPQAVDAGEDAGESEDAGVTDAATSAADTGTNVTDAGDDVIADAGVRRDGAVSSAPVASEGGCGCSAPGRSTGVPSIASVMALACVASMRRRRAQVA